jgi:hypothetical protein
MAKSTQARDVLAVLLGVEDPKVASNPPSREYPLKRRVLASLLGVSLPGTPQSEDPPPDRPKPTPPTGRLGPPAATHWQRFSRFLIGLVGADFEILDRVPTERMKFESQGWAVLITSGTATISMWFALSSALGMNGFAAVLFALGWGVTILFIDRWLITTMPLGSSRRKFIFAVPRLLLAVLLGFVIATPLVLRIFQPEINDQMVIIKAQQYSTYVTSLQRSQSGQQASSWQAQVTSLQKVIDSKGQAPLNPSADPVVQALSAQLNKAFEQEQGSYRQWQCQLYGGSGCPAGNGTLAQTAHSSYEQAAAQVTQLNSEIRARDEALTAAAPAAAQSRFEEAKNTLPGAEQQLALAQGRLNAERADFTAEIDSDNGLLVRLTALSQLSSHNPNIGVARALLLLLFLVIECLPVTVKLLQRPGIYEIILARQEERRVKVALMQRQLMSGQEESRPTTHSAYDTPRSEADSDVEPQSAPRNVVPDDLKREIEGIYPFMNETGEGTPPEYREELESCFLAISKGVNELLRQGYDNEQIIEALRIATDTVARQLADARQEALEKNPLRREA